MILRTEALFWQVMGAVAALGGGFLLLHAFSRYGLATLDSRAIQLEIAGSFMLASGLLGFVTGRGMHAEERGTKKLESVLWLILGVVGIVAGIATVITAQFIDTYTLTDRLTMRLAGAFSIMLGIICLLGQRLMARMHGLGAGIGSKTGKKASAAGA